MPLPLPRDIVAEPCGGVHVAALRRPAAAAAEAGEGGAASAVAGAAAALHQLPKDGEEPPSLELAEEAA
eukprot:gene7588-4912_t